jgi:quercetin dioxygenase-like cupin family protein
MTIEPGGIVAWHSHADRPAIIYIIEGEINEYASNCAVPITHKAGDVVAEIKISHWWKNLGHKTVVLLSADLLRVAGATAVEAEAIGCC